MKSVGILETGSPPSALGAVYGNYPGMIRNLLKDHYSYRDFNVSANQLPDRADMCDAYIITGSSADAFSTADWISTLKQFLRGARKQAALIGICFGHQIMAEAFGGKVARSDKGWGIGVHHYAVTNKRPWMDEREVFSLIASHQDQVVELPASARVIGSSYFCPVAAIEYENCAAISFQAHPEFTPGFARDLIEAKPNAGYTAEQAEIAIETLDEMPVDNSRIAEAIHRFLTR